MRPLRVTLAGVAVGVLTVLPLARAHVADQQRLELTTSPGRPAGGEPGSSGTSGRAGGSDGSGTTSAPARQVDVTGPSVDTRYGPVQVELVLNRGRITAATAVRTPDRDGTSRQINSYAAPQLEREAIALQDAQVDTVSGATYTSDGYRKSLQAALDAARAAAGVNGR